MARFGNVFRLGIKELRSLFSDPILLAIIAFAFTLGIYSAATGMSQELHNSAIAIVDQDRTPVTRKIAAGFRPPHFRAPREIDAADVDRLQDHGEASFVLVFPPGFERDLKAGRRPEMQLDVDATNVSQAFIGAGYIQAIVGRELAEFLHHEPPEDQLPIALVSRVRFNPNLTSSWFTGVMELTNQITMLSIVLVGAAVIREREHGTLEHLLVMPVSSFEIMVAKVWANGLVVLLASGFSLAAIVRGALGMPIAGSIPLFLFATAVYLFCTTAVGILLGTLARSMPQFGLLIILTILPLAMLSGTVTPRESMPVVVRNLMLLAPSTHFVRIAQAILFRGAGWKATWPSLAAIVALGIVAFQVAHRRFRVAVTQTQI